MSVFLTTASKDTITRFKDPDAEPKPATGAPIASRAPGHGLLGHGRLGYRPGNETLDAALNRSMAALVLLASAPLFGLITLLQLIFAPGPIFYRGARLGKDRVPFDILKFRTLEVQARKVTADRTLPRRNLTETSLGSYLRASRLDELPQLVNILRGEMVFFGPRPIRPEIEWIYRAEAPGYEARFQTRPGLVGLAQAIMTHETPKSVRARFNRAACASQVRYGALAGFVCYVGFCVLRKSVRAVFQAAGDALSPIGEHKWLRSGFSRPPNARVELDLGDKTLVGAICGISDETIQFVSTKPFAQGECQVSLLRQRRGGRIIRVRATLLIETVMPVGPGKSGFVHYASYRVRSKNAQHFIERYFLRSAVVPS